MLNVVYIVAVSAIVLRDSDGASSKPTEKIATQEDGEKDLYVIGDTHGSMRFLSRALLATGQFELLAGDDVGDDDFGLAWVDGADAEVVVLGDVVDRGLHDRAMLLMLRKLCLDKVHGSQLQVLIGNHEAMAMRMQHQYAPDELAWQARKPLVWSKWAKDTWRLEDRLDGFGQTTGEQGWLGWNHAPPARLARARDNAALMVWLRSLDVIALKGEVLMMHGGLSLPVLERVRKTLEHERAERGEEAKAASGAEVVQWINDHARKYFRAVRDCWKVDKVDSAAASAGRSLAKISQGGWFGRKLTAKGKLIAKGEFWNKEKPGGCPRSLPFFLGAKEGRRVSQFSQSGVLWYRGYTSVKHGHGAGSEPACEEANEVARLVGAQALALGHTSMKHPTRWCPYHLSNASSEMVEIFGGVAAVYAVDTHAPFSCEDGECALEGATVSREEAQRRVPTALHFAPAGGKGQQRTVDVCVWGAWKRPEEEVDVLTVNKPLCNEKWLDKAVETKSGVKFRHAGHGFKADYLKRGRT